MVSETHEIFELLKKFSQDYEYFQFWDELKRLGQGIRSDRDKSILNFLGLK